MTDTTQHFAPWGSVATSCGKAVPRDRTSVTDRRRDTTCPRCRARFTNPADTPTPQPLAELIEELRAFARAETIRGLTLTGDRYARAASTLAAMLDQVEVLRVELAVQVDAYGDLVRRSTVGQAELSGQLEEARMERARLAAVIERAPHGVTCSGWSSGRILWAGGLCDCWKSAASPDALAEVKREAAARGQLDILTDLADEEMQTNGATLRLERLLARAATIRKGQA